MHSIKTYFALYEITARLVRPCDVPAEILCSIGPVPSDPEKEIVIYGDYEGLPGRITHRQASLRIDIQLHPRAAYCARAFHPDGSELYFPQSGYSKLVRGHWSLSKLERELRIWAQRHDFKLTEAELDHLVPDSWQH